MTATSMINNRPIKWATHRASPMLTKKASYRIQKKTRNQNHTRSCVNAVVSNLKEENDDLMKLEKELAYSYDTMATITVHFESLYHAYHNSKSKLDQNKTATRLCEMEKELLTAYDDLELQVKHFESKIGKLEQRMKQLKKEEEVVTVSSPCSSLSDTDSASSTPCLNYIQTPLCYEQPPAYDLFQSDIIFNNQYYYEPILFM